LHFFVEGDNLEVLKLLQESYLGKVKMIYSDWCSMIYPRLRVLKTDSTNMKDVYYSAGEYSQANLFDLAGNIKEDCTDLDLLYGA